MKPVDKKQRKAERKEEKLEEAIYEEAFEEFTRDKKKYVKRKNPKWRHPRITLAICMAWYRQPEKERLEYLRKAEQKIVKQKKAGKGLKSSGSTKKSGADFEDPSENTNDCSFKLGMETPEDSSSLIKKQRRKSLNSRVSFEDDAKADMEQLSQWEFTIGSDPALEPTTGSDRDWDLADSSEQDWEFDLEFASGSEHSKKKPSGPMPTFQPNAAQMSGWQPNPTPIPTFQPNLGPVPAWQPNQGQRFPVGPSGPCMPSRPLGRMAHPQSMPQFNGMGGPMRQPHMVGGPRMMQPHFGGSMSVGARSLGRSSITSGVATVRTAPPTTNNMSNRSSIASGLSVRTAPPKPAARRNRASLSPMRGSGMNRAMPAPQCHRHSLSPHGRGSGEAGVKQRKVPSGPANRAIALPPPPLTKPSQ